MEIGEERKGVERSGRYRLGEKVEVGVCGGFCLFSFES